MVTNDPNYERKTVAKEGEKDIKGMPVSEHAIMKVFQQQEKNRLNAKRMNDYFLKMKIEKEQKSIVKQKEKEHENKMN